jgi:hypothetical protein
LTKISKTATIKLCHDFLKRLAKMKCRKCKSENCQIIQEVNTSHGDYNTKKGVIGYLLLGPLGLLFGRCGRGKQTKTISFWLCHNCGRKWKI